MLRLKVVNVELTICNDGDVDWLAQSRRLLFSAVMVMSLLKIPAGTSSCTSLNKSRSPFFEARHACHVAAVVTWQKDAVAECSTTTAATMVRSMAFI